MRLLDSNIVIDSGKAGAEAVWELIGDGLACVSAVTYIEVLGYHRLADADREDFEEFFSMIQLLLITPAVMAEAIRLRQIRRMSLGDSLIAGTALVHGLVLITRNVGDFSWVEGLTVIDPTESV